MNPIDENDLAAAIARCEGGKVNVNVAQIKEVLRITLELMSGMKASQVMALVEKHGG